MSQNAQSSASTLEPFQTPEKMDIDDADQNTKGSAEGHDLPSQLEPKPTPALTKRKKFKDLFQSPSDSLVSPMSRTLCGKTHPLLLKQKTKPKRLNSEEDTEKK